MLRKAWKAWNRYWFGPGSVFDLAVVRIVLVGYELLFRFRFDEPGLLTPFSELTALPDAFYDPLPALHLLIWPLGWTYRPGMETLEAVLWITFFFGILSLIGLLTNLSLLAFTLGLVFLQAHEYSFGDFHHVQSIALIGLGALALSPAGRALSVDAWLRRRRRGGRPNDPPRDPPRPRHGFARWPLRLIAWTLALIYLSSAWSKVNPEQGLAWLNGFALQHGLLRDGLRDGNALGLWLGGQHELAVVLSWVTVLFEATFVLAVLRPRLRPWYVAWGTGLHLGIYVFMLAPFFSFIAAYSALLPWERWWTRLRSPPRSP